MWSATDVLTALDTDDASDTPASRSPGSSPPSPPSSGNPPSSPPTSSSSPPRSPRSPAPHSSARKDPAVEPTTTTPTDTTESDGLFVRAWRRIWAVWTMTVRMYVVVAVVGIGVIVNYGIKENLKAVDERQRAADARDAALIAYTAQLRTHDLEVRERDDCLTDVARADDNRGQHEALVAALERLFPDSQLTADLVAELRAGPLLSAEPRSIADCPAPPVAPVIPPELIGASS